MDSPPRVAGRRVLPRAGAAACIALLAACGGEEAPNATLVPDGAALRAQRTATVIERAAAASEERDLSDIGSIGGGPWIGDPRLRPLTSEAFAEVDRSDWPDELFALELTSAQLWHLRRLVLGTARADELAGVFTADAALASPALSLGEPVPAAHTVVRRPWEIAEDPPLFAPGEWLGEVERWRAGFHRLRYFRCVPERVALGAADEGWADVDLHWTLSAELPTGGLVLAQGTFESRWVRDEPSAEDEAPGSARGWRCRRLAPGQGSTLESEAPAFVDVTLEALEGTVIDPRRPKPLDGFNRSLALGDLDADGDLDLVTTLPNRVFHNDGDGRFREVTEEVNAASSFNYYGVLVADFDRDGDADVLLSGMRCHVLALENVDGKGNYRQKPITASSDGNIPSSLSAHDVDGDGFLDVFVCGYGAFFSPGPEEPGNARNGRPNRMLRGLPGLEFEDVTEAWGLDAESTRWAFIGAFGDADEDGDVDLYVAHDFGPNVLYRRADGEGVRFEAEVERADVIDPGFSMSATWMDLDGDLDNDMYVSNMSSIEALRLLDMEGNARSPEKVREMRRRMAKGNTILVNAGGGDEPRALVEGADELGARDAAWAWGTALFDWELDGDVDIACVNGFWSAGMDDGRDWDSVWWRHGLSEMERDPTTWNPTFSQFAKSADYGWSWAGHQRSVFYVNDGSGHFTELGAVLGVDQSCDGRGLAAGDIDGDGDLDLVGTSYSPPHVYVLRNDARTDDAHFLIVDTEPAEHASPAGTRLFLTAGGRTQRRDQALGEGFLSQHEMAEWFGLGEADAVERLVVQWPDGSRQELEDLTVDCRIVVAQGQEGFREVPLRPRNWSATGRVAEIEWSDWAHRLIRAPQEYKPDFSEIALVTADGETLSFSTRPKRSPTIAILFEPGDEACERALADLEELREHVPDIMRLMAVCLDAAVTDDVLRDVSERLGLGYPVARLVDPEDRPDIDHALQLWAGPLGLDLPFGLHVSNNGQVVGVFRGAIPKDAMLLNFGARGAGGR